MFIKVKKAKYLGDYKIKITFNDGNEGIVDLSESLEGKVFERLKDKQNFSKFRVDEELGTIVWENGVDLAPEYLYFLAFKNRKELLSKFKEWKYIYQIRNGSVSVCQSVDKG